MQGSLLMIALASGVCSHALAGDSTVRIPADQMLDGSTWATNFKPSTERGLTTVYSGLNTNTSAAWEVNSTFSAHGAEDFSFANGPAATNASTPLRTFGTFLARAAHPTVKSFDLVVRVWDSACDGCDDLFQSGTLLGSFRVEFRNIPDGSFWTGDLDISTLGIVVPGSGGAVELLVTAPGAATPIKNGEVSVCNGQGVLDVSTMSLTNEAGSSLQYYWRDTQNQGTSGVIRGGVDRRFTGLSVSHGMFAVRMKSDVTPCPADFNGDGFTDVYDFVDFVNSLESGCN